MGHAKEAVAILLFFNAFVLFLYNPIQLSFDYSVLLGFAALVVFGALVGLAGMIRIPAYYTLPLGLLVFLDMKMLGLFLFALLGVGAAGSIEKNAVKPNIRRVMKGAFVGFPILLIFFVFPIYQSAEIKIPEAIMAPLIGRISPMVIGCEADMTGTECVDQHVTELIYNQCDGNNECIQILNSQRETLEQEEIKQFSSIIPNFNSTKTLQESVTDAVNAQIESFLGPYSGLFKLLVAFAIFSVFSFLRGPIVILSSLVGILVIKLLLVTKIVRKKKVKVDKTIFSA